MTRVLHWHNTKNKFNIWLSTHIAIPYTRILYSAVVNALEPTENHRVKSALIIIDFFANKTLRRRSLINTLSLQIRLFVVVNLFDGLWHVNVCVCYVVAVRVCMSPSRTPVYDRSFSVLCTHYRRSVCTLPKQSIQNNESESETEAAASNSNNNKNINNNNNNNNKQHVYTYMCEKHCFKFHVHVLIHSTTKHLNCATRMCVSSELHSLVVAVFIVLTHLYFGGTYVDKERYRTLRIDHSIKIGQKELASAHVRLNTHTHTHPWQTICIFFGNHFARVQPSVH